jgi:hypothetical protein
MKVKYRSSHVYKNGYVTCSGTGWRRKLCTATAVAMESGNAVGSLTHRQVIMKPEVSSVLQALDCVGAMSSDPGVKRSTCYVDGD